MKWSAFKNEITNLPDSEKEALELMASLAAIRKSKNITQEQLAERSKLTQAQIARAENLTYTPSLLTIMRIINGLDIKIAFIDKATKKIVSDIKRSEITCMKSDKLLQVALERLNDENNKMLPMAEVLVKETEASNPYETMTDEEFFD